MKSIYKILLFISILANSIYCVSQERPILKIDTLGRDITLVQPSLETRLGCASGFKVFEPERVERHSDAYIFSHISYYFSSLSRPVDIVKTKYKEKSPQKGVTQFFVGSHKKLDKTYDNTNYLVIVPNLVRGKSDLGHLYIDISDLVNNWTWRVHMNVPPVSVDFLSVLQQNLVPIPKDSVESKDIFVPEYFVANWKEEQLYIDDFVENGCDFYEGIYKYNDIKCALKKYTDGNYYLFYIGGGKSDMWKDDNIGTVKAVLSPSLMSGYLSGEYYDDYRVSHDSKFLVGSNRITILTQDENITFTKQFPIIPRVGLGQNENEPQLSSGTGFALENGYIATNYHVIEDAQSIVVQGVGGDLMKSYRAKVVATDKLNDLALLKVTDTDFNGFGEIPYSIASSASEAGENIHVLGYPLITDMGKDIKLSTGIVSSKTGFKGDISLYQISAPVLPGNSGGPVFDDKGDIIGVVCSKLLYAENTSYAVKSIYLRNLIESCGDESIMPNNNLVSNLNITEKVKVEKNFVFLIICSTPADNLN